MKKRVIGESYEALHERLVHMVAAAFPSCLQRLGVVNLWQAQDYPCRMTSPTVVWVETGHAETLLLFVNAKAPRT